MEVIVVSAKSLAQFTSHRAYPSILAMMVIVRLVTMGKGQVRAIRLQGCCSLKHSTRISAGEVVAIGQDYTSQVARLRWLYH